MITLYLVVHLETTIVVVIDSDYVGVNVAFAALLVVPDYIATLSWILS